MPEDRITKFLDLIEDVSPEELAELVHEALQATPDDEQAVAACVEWADTAMQMEALMTALTERLADQAAR